MSLIEIGYNQRGRTVYAIIHNPNGDVWNNNSLAFEAFNPSDWTDYAVSLTEQGSSGYYEGTYPTQITGVLTTELIYDQQTGSPAQSDTIISVGQTQGANIVTVAGSALAGSNLGLSAGSIVQGKAQTGTLSTTQMTTNLTYALAGAYNGRTVIWTSGALAGVAAAIVGYLVLNGKMTFTAVPVAPSNNDTFIIV